MYKKKTSQLSDTEWGRATQVHGSWWILNELQQSALPRPLIHPFTQIHTAMAGCCHTRCYEPHWDQVRVERLAQQQNNRLGWREIFILFIFICLNFYVYVFTPADSQ